MVSSAKETYMPQQTLAVSNALRRTDTYEEVYIKDYQTMEEATANLGEYFSFYDNVRLHQALGYLTPAAVYQN